MTSNTEAVALFSLDKFTEGSTAWLYWAEFNGNIDQGEARTVEEAEAKAFAYLSQFKEITNIISKYKPEKEDYRFELDEDQLLLGYKDADEWKQAQV